MPKETFLNLSEEKQDKIIQVAIDEFAEYGFDLSSIQRIVKASCISRGSFYQYFEDKADIYYVVVSKLRDEKMLHIAPVISMQEDLGFFDFLKILYKKAFEFARKNPKAVQIGRAMLSSKTLDKERFLKRLTEEGYAQIHSSPDSLYLKSIQNSIDRGEITDSYSIETINFYVTVMIEGMTKLMVSKNISDPFGDEGEQVLTEFISMLKHGLCKKENN